MSEEWRPVPGYERTYEVSSLGRVRSHPRPRTRGGILKVKVDKRGYPAVSLGQDGRQSTREVHQLVALAFIGPRPDGQEVRHADGDRLNPVAANLTYGTRRQNIMDAVAHGTHPTGGKTHCPQNHPYDDANTRLYRGSRYCRECKHIRERRGV